MNEIKQDGVFYGHYKGISIHQFARDLLLFGNSRVVELCESYGMSAQLFQEIIELPAFKKEMRELRALIEASPNALIQLKARTIVEEGLEELRNIIRKAPREADKIKAMELLTKIGGAMPTGRDNAESGAIPQASGLVLNVNLGPTGLIPQHVRTGPLRKVKDVTPIMSLEE